MCLAVGVESEEGEEDTSEREEGTSEKLILILYILEFLSLWPLNILLELSLCHFEGISQVNQVQRNWPQNGSLSK